jgi:hypothetical protein
VGAVPVAGVGGYAVIVVCAVTTNGGVFWAWQLPPGKNIQPSKSIPSALAARTGLFRNTSAQSIGIVFLLICISVRRPFSRPCSAIDLRPAHRPDSSLRRLRQKLYFKLISITRLPVL